MMTGSFIKGLFIISVALRIQAQGVLTDREVYKIKNEAFDYIMSQRNNVSHGWNDGQSSIALLGLLSARPTWSDDSHALSYKQLEIEILREAIQDNALEELDSANLAAMGGAFLAGCYDLQNVNGLNLLSIMKRRLRKTPSSSPAYGALALVLCSELRGAELDGVLDGLDNHYQLGKNCPYCVEVSAVRLQALLCLIKHAQGDHEKRISKYIFRNQKYLYSVENTRNGDFGNNLFQTSLASVALFNTSPKKTVDESRFSLSKDYLLKHRRPDGSFEGSLRITTSVLSAFSSFTADQIKIACEHKYKARAAVENKEYAFFKINDGVFTQQSVRFRVPLKSEEKTSLYDALLEYSKNNPQSFQISIKETFLGQRLVGINELENDRGNRSFWRIYYVKKGRSKKQRIPLTRGLEKIFLKKNITYLFSFQQV